MKEEHLTIRASVKEPLARRLLRNGHLFGALFGVLLWALHLGGVFLPKPAQTDAVAHSVEEATLAFEARLEAATYPSREVFDRMNAAKAKAESLWGPLPGSPPPASEYLAHPEALVRAARAGEKNRILFLAPRDLSCSADRGSVRLSWVNDPDTNVGVVATLVLRGLPGRESEEIARVPGGETSYDDASVRPGVTYTYQVVAVTDDRLVVAQGITRSPVSKPYTVTAAADFRLTLLSIADDDSSAEIRVEKWHEDDWWSRNFRVKPGDTVGKPDAGTDLDFRTHRRVVRIGRRKLLEKRQMERAVFDPEGRVILAGEEARTELVEVVDESTVLEVELDGGDLPPQTLSLDQKS